MKGDKNTMKDKKLILACILMVCSVLLSAIGMRVSYRHGYEAGRKTAIESAKIVDIAETTYNIDYDGEVHTYKMSIDQIYLLVRWANNNAEMYKF